jgi:hypothetical protein
MRTKNGTHSFYTDAVELNHHSIKCSLNFIVNYFVPGQLLLKDMNYPDKTNTEHSVKAPMKH